MTKPKKAVSVVSFEVVIDGQTYKPKAKALDLQAVEAQAAADAKAAVKAESVVADATKSASERLRVACASCGGFYTARRQGGETDKAAFSAVRKLVTDAGGDAMQATRIARIARGFAAGVPEKAGESLTAYGKRVGSPADLSGGAGKSRADTPAGKAKAAKAIVSAAEAFHAKLVGMGADYRAEADKVAAMLPGLTAKAEQAEAKAKAATTAL